MKELPKICNRLKQDLYNLYKFTQDTLVKNVSTVTNDVDDINKSIGNILGEVETSEKPNMYRLSLLPNDSVELDLTNKNGATIITYRNGYGLYATTTWSNSVNKLLGSDSSVTFSKTGTKLTITAGATTEWGLIIM